MGLFYLMNRIFSIKKGKGTMLIFFSTSNFSPCSIFLLSISTLYLFLIKKVVSIISVSIL